MHHRRNHRVRPDEFRRRVRRFPRDALLRGIASMAAKEANQRNLGLSFRDEKFSVVREGYLFQIAGICVTHCNNHRNTPVNDEAVNDLIDGLHSVLPAELTRSHELRTWLPVLSRMAYQQMPYQVSPWEPMMRSLCLFGDDSRFGEPVFEDGRWEAILGVTLQRFLMIGFIMHLAAIRNEGRISRATLISDHVRPTFEPVGVDAALQVVDSWLVLPVDELANLGREHTPDADDLWRFNPLL